MFFNPIFPKAVMNDFGEMVRQKIDGIRKQKKNVEMINDMFIRSIEETSFNVEVLSDPDAAEVHRKKGKFYGK